ncbi:AI-2E family transporter [Chitinophaga japonensis]|uniref:Putative PurR-regulated permease PerM n=1 Tax=Chitinophaga japonensis TaxID=104662 RepID=A0A562SNG8_CHIJA|nr:AI-2E family transporter [Chitinophaga japonensis]TWI82653.1 putative PurR-regulated permease PerM [Chitinophaga japonensis]
MNENKLPFNARLAYSLVSLVLIIYLAHLAASIIIPLVFASLVAIMLLPLAAALEQWRIPRGLAAFVAVLIFVIALSALLLILAAQMGAFISDFPQLQRQLLESLDSLQLWINEKFQINADKQMAYLEQLAMGTLGSATTFLSQTLGAVSSIVIFVVFVLLYSFFLLLYRSLLIAFLAGLFKERHREKLLDVIGQTRFIIKSYASGLVIEMIVVAVMNCTIFWIMGIKYATLLGIMAAIFNLIPYLGIFTAIVLSMIVTLTTGTPAASLQVGIALMIVHFLDSNILLPRIVGSKVKINALVTIIGVVTGNLLWGIPGMFLAIPIMAMLKIIFEHVEEMRPWAILLGELPDRRKPRFARRR